MLTTASNPGRFALGQYVGHFAAGQYVGRFAPSPTGPLHVGSLVAAVGSYLDARTHNGTWRVRMEDVDEPRCAQHHADEILRQLEAHGLTWDGDVIYQSQRKPLYQSALDQLIKRGAAFPCGCTRREIADSTLHGIEGPVYPGTCRHGLNGKTARAWRVRVNDAPICFEDRLLGPQCQQLDRDIGDYIVKRADGFFAYQLAVVVDDFEQGITHVVRGSDLLASTPRQIHLQTLLNYPTPAYLHLPVVTNEAGQKLSKQTLAPVLDNRAANQNLWAALDFLGLKPAQELKRANADDLLAWSIANWRR